MSGKNLLTSIAQHAVSKIYNFNLITDLSRTVFMPVYAGQSPLFTLPPLNYKPSSQQALTVVIRWRVSRWMIGIIYISIIINYAFSLHLIYNQDMSKEHFSSWEHQELDKGGGARGRFWDYQNEKKHTEILWQTTRRGETSRTPWSSCTGTFMGKPPVLAFRRGEGSWAEG